MGETRFTAHRAFPTSSSLWMSKTIPLPRCSSHSSFKDSLIGKSRGLQTCSSQAGELLSLPRAIRSSSEDTTEQPGPSQHPKCPSCKSLSSFPLCPTATAPLTCPRAASPGERPPALLPFFSQFPLLGSCLLSAAASYCLVALSCQKRWPLLCCCFWVGYVQDSSSLLLLSL